MKTAAVPENGTAAVYFIPAILPGHFCIKNPTGKTFFTAKMLKLFAKPCISRRDVLYWKMVYYR